MTPGQDRSPPLGAVIEDLHRRGMDWAMQEAGTASPDAPETRGLSSADVVRLAAISVRQLNYWTHHGHLRPGGGKGSGDFRKWPAAEIEIAARMGRLTAAGFPLEWAAWFARESWPTAEIAPGIQISVTA